MFYGPCRRIIGVAFNEENQHAVSVTSTRAAQSEKRVYSPLLNASLATRPSMSCLSNSSVLADSDSSKSTVELTLREITLDKPLHQSVGQQSAYSALKSVPKLHPVALGLK